MYWTYILRKLNTKFFLGIAYCKLYSCMEVNVNGYLNAEVA